MKPKQAAPPAPAGIYTRPFSPSGPRKVVVYKVIKDGRKLRLIRSQDQ